MSFARSMRLLVFALALSPALAAAADTYDVDSSHSSVIFGASHLGISNFYGRFNTTSGSFTIDGANPAASEVAFTIDTNSIDTANTKRDDHLRSPDFFDAKQFPVIRFESTSVKAKGANVFEVAGNLTIHGVTKPVTLNVTKIGEGSDPWGGYRSGYETRLSLKRSDYGMKYMIPGVGDDIQLILSVEGIKK